MQARAGAPDRAVELFKEALAIDARHIPSWQVWRILYATRFAAPRSPRRRQLALIPAGQRAATVRGDRARPGRGRLDPHGVKGD